MSVSALHEALARQPHHVSPFLVLGDPSPDISVELAAAAVSVGATMLELGMPFSDPCADGPAIQAACGRAFAAGVSTERALDILARIHSTCPDVPKNLLVYGNLVHARGWDRFCGDAVSAGASTLLCPDVPLEEGSQLRRASAAAGLGHVELVGPSTPPARLRQIDEATDGFLYLAAHQGITGRGADPDVARQELVRRTVAAVRQPVCLGFGLSTRAHLEQAFLAGARIAVVGSHLARVIERAFEQRGTDADHVVRSFAEACRPLCEPLNQPISEED